ncbi:MAG TPA: hypothetical protein PK400_05320 [Phycisphaerales bacterium]|nr:hypothetical protein [Phycisphaerales bacterium]HRQ75301.1 hypothetical protein [Phycisphaerales bacterium]
MRIVINTMILIMIAALIMGGAMYRQTMQEETALLERTRAEVDRFVREINVQRTMEQVEQSSRGYPLTIEPAWFKNGLPMNPLLNGNHPWLEIASEDQHDLNHPPDRIAVRRDQAMFWYNPANGRLRARVPVAMSDAAALKAYNFINNSALQDIIGDEETPIVDVPVPNRRSR